MFRITGQRRRRFVNFVNRNLENALGLNNNDVQEIEDNAELQIQRLQQLRQLLAAIPRGLRRIVHNDVLDRIREALRGLRIDQIPEELLNQLNEIF